MNQNPWSAMCRERGYHAEQGSLESLPLADSSVDIVTLKHTLEHVKYPLRALREVRRVLRPGGVALIVVPDTSYWKIALTPKTAKAFRPGKRGWQHHVYFYEHNLIDAARRSGLEVVRRGKAIERVNRHRSALFEPFRFGWMQLFTWSGKATRLRQEMQNLAVKPLKFKVFERIEAPSSRVLRECGTMVAPLPNLTFRPIRAGTVPGGPNFGSNKLATEALVQATRSHSVNAIRTMAAPQLATMLKNVNAAFEGHLGPSAQIMRSGSQELVGSVQGAAEARPVLNALEYRRAELTAEIERTGAPGGHDTKMKTLMSSQYQAKFHWDAVSSKVFLASAALSKAYSFNLKSDPEYLSIMAQLGTLNQTADHNSSYHGAVKLAAHLRPLAKALDAFVTPFKASGWTSPSGPKEAIGQLSRVRDQITETLALLDQHTALVSERPPMFLID